MRNKLKKMAKIGIFTNAKYNKNNANASRFSVTYLAS